MAHLVKPLQVYVKISSPMVSSREDFSSDLILSQEKDACGIGFVAYRHGLETHEIIRLALHALGRHLHRGARHADGKTGDGAGLLTEIPYRFFREYLESRGISPPLPQDLAVGMVFLPQGKEDVGIRILEESVEQEKLRALTWREVPVDIRELGEHALSTKPSILQIILKRTSRQKNEEAFEHALYRARKRAELRALKEGLSGFYIPSLSHRTIVYKGLLLAHRLGNFYLDLLDPGYESSFAIFHQRYSTNTFPSWHLAQPFRLICHNGEINTLAGNISWMLAREKALRKDFWGEDYELFAEIIDLSGSDSSIFDNVLELFVQQGYDIRHALMMMVPEAWEHLGPEEISPSLRAFYRFHENLMEPWDGPAAIAFTWERLVGMALDRNGLRPARYTILANGLVVAASEAGVIPIEESQVTEKGMIAPGEMIAVDLREGKIWKNPEIKEFIASRRRYESLCKKIHVPLPHASSTPRPSAFPGLPEVRSSGEEFVKTLLAFGYTHEEEIMIIRPMITQGQEPVGSMGDDTPLAVLSQFYRPLFHYFKQRFAQVTNPPMDPIREEMVMSLRTVLGKRPNILDPESDQVLLLELPSPILDPSQFERILSYRGSQGALSTALLSTLWEVKKGEEGFVERLERLIAEAEELVRKGATLLILSDRGVDEDHSFIPSLLAVSAVHHHLISRGLRLETSLIVDSGEPREVHHFACLIGYGADAIYPYLLYELCLHLFQEGGRQFEGLTPEKGLSSLIRAIEKGILKIMAKMGIAPLSSYRGAQVFEAIGLSREFVQRYFPRTPTSVEGVGIPRIVRDLSALNEKAFRGGKPHLESQGFYKYKSGGEVHAFSPEVIQAIHEAVGLNHKIPREKQTPPPLAEGISDAYRRFVKLVQDRPPIHLRDLLGFRRLRPPVPLEEVEPVSEILKRFSTAAMSHGALSSEAHETIAIALNRLGGLSNSGEGGEDEIRYSTEANSKIKQVASGRFGVTVEYLNSAIELQIKMAQGSKPGEGGQLPGHKVNEEIARIRHTRPGVALISPPPHHDIYSIEDLAQLIYDLKQINPSAYISVKLVSETGVGTIAAGVAKGYADVIHISGHSGGTGASPLSSIKHAGLPWEIGLAETHQTLLRNGLRSRVRVRVDGTFQVGRDVVIAALLGADEVSFGTIAMVAEGCIMARACHTNNCPVGVATQKLELRAKFPGLPEHAMNYFLQLAYEVREIMADLGFRTFAEMVGRTEFLEQVIHGESAHYLDLSPLLAQPAPLPPPQHSWPRNVPPNHEENLGVELTQMVEKEWTKGTFPIILGERERMPIHNEERTVGARLSNFLLRHRGEKENLPDPCIIIRLKGSAGQSFGAFLARGILLDLEGEANDYVGKGLSGGTIIIRPFAENRFPWHEATIMGNTVLYGATSGKLFACGRAGQRFAVRNSGAIAVIEGASDHCCEYMTGGIVVVLGPVGRNFGAGMSAGLAFVYDPEERYLRHRLNPQLVQPQRLERSSEDEQILKNLISEHFHYTSSPRAEWILSHWDEAVEGFFKVAPKVQVATIEAQNEGVVAPSRAKVA
jgi:glutamate synthase (ferredoxin)